jgi:hypothetical protein
VRKGQLIHRGEAGVCPDGEGSFGGGPVPCYFGAPRVQHRYNEQFPPGRKPEATGHAVDSPERPGEEGTGTWQLEL